MDFVDQALARRLESAEEMPQVHYAHLYQKLKPEIGAAVEPICGGHMIFAGLNSPIGRTVGMGFDGSATAADLDRMEQFYRSHGAPSQIDVCPLTDPPLFEMLKQRSYVMAEFNNVSVSATRPGRSERSQPNALPNNHPPGQRRRSLGLLGNRRSQLLSQRRRTRRLRGNDRTDLSGGRSNRLRRRNRWQDLLPAAPASSFPNVAS